MRIARLKLGAEYAATVDRISHSEESYLRVRVLEPCVAAGHPIRNYVRVQVEEMPSSPAARQLIRCRLQADRSYLLRPEQLISSWDDYLARRAKRRTHDKAVRQAVELAAQSSPHDMDWAASEQEEVLQALLEG